jgi:hypothetical protein
MKLKIIFEFNKINFTREEISRVLETAAVLIETGQNNGSISIGEKDCAHWELYPRL